MYHLVIYSLSQTDRQTDRQTDNSTMTIADHSAWKYDCLKMVSLPIIFLYKNYLNLSTCNSKILTKSTA